MLLTITPPSGTEHVRSLLCPNIIMPKFYSVLALLTMFPNPSMPFHSRKKFEPYIYLYISIHQYSIGITVYILLHTSIHTFLCYNNNSLVPRLYPRTQTNCNLKRGKAWDISSCDLTSNDVQVDRLYRKLVPTQATSLGSSSEPATRT